ncbi:phage integrase family protein [Geobacter sp. FeAm09]|uniref:phage integrase family protein n=1 Tax=Geobacter sp. FeAm09 TaxID=2597769 RepID=UPI0011F0162B|nr:phage integrase family protein [Geobacter sp. FeAm09]QEM67403.1 phage integrase family protein [Geobacter sp. FeAm09]
MRGNFNSQVGRLFQEINGVGTSKFADKQEARSYLMDRGESATSSAVATLTSIHNNGTNEGYFDKCVELAKWAREVDGIKDVEKITSAHVAAFLAEKIDLGVSLSHWNGYSAAFSKLEQAQVKFSQAVRGVEKDFSYRAAVAALRPEARAELHRFEGTRNYSDPTSLIAALRTDIGRLAAEIQREGGLRITAASRISPDQLKGLVIDKYTGELRGQIEYICKGGAVLTTTVSQHAYSALQSHILKNGEFAIGHKAYRTELKAAAAATSQTFNSSHGLRWNFAQERFSDLLGRGVSYEKALGVVSAEMGHHRISITEHYVFGK